MSVENESLSSTLQEKLNNLKEPMRENANPFKAIFSNSSQEIHLWEIIKNNKDALMSWKLVDINPSALQSWGKAKKNVIGKTGKELFGNEDAKLFSPIIQEIIETKKPKEWQAYFSSTKQHLKLKSILLGNYFITMGDDISNKVAEEKKLQESEKIRNEVFNNSFSFTGLIKPDGTFIDINKTALDFTGLTKEDVIGLKIYDAPWWKTSKEQETRNTLKQHIKKVLLGEFVRYEVEVVGKNNTLLTIDFSLKPVYDSENKIAYIIPEGRDISNQVLFKHELKKLNKTLEKRVKKRTKKLNKALKSIEQYKLAAEMSQVGVWRWDFKTDKQEWDQTIYDLFGLKRGEFKRIVDACLAGIHEEDRERVEQEFKNYKYNHEDFDSIFKVIKRNTGETIFVRAKGKVEFDKNGEAVALYGTKYDVSREMKISHERNIFARELKQQYQLISSASIILITDVFGNIIEVNENFCKKSGYAEKELLEQNYQVIMEDFFTPEYYININTTVLQGENWSGLLCSRNKNGNKVWLQTTISPFRNADGKIEKFVSVSFDITEQKNLEFMARKNQEHLMNQSKELLKISRELTKQKQLLQAVFDNTDFMIFLKDINGKFLLVNKQLCKNLELGDPEAVIGRSDFDYFDKETALDFYQKDKEIMQKGTVETFEEKIQLPKGESIFLTSKFPIYDESFKVSGVCGISVDITEKKQNERKLKEAQAKIIQSEKMATLGLLTAGVAHEINNPLNYISGGYQSIEKHLDSNETINPENIKKFVSWIKVGTERATKIVRGLNDLTRDNLDFNETCNVSKILNETLAIVNNKIINRITIVKEFDNNNYIIKGNIGKLHQLFLNLLTNAIDAIKNEGTIVIKLVEKDKQLLIEIRDDGEGINKNSLKKIIEPFYTTKPPGSGTGLGLYISNNIIKEHKGKLKIDSEKGIGTSILIQLPK